MLEVAPGFDEDDDEDDEVPQASQGADLESFLRPMYYGWSSLD